MHSVRAPDTSALGEILASVGDAGQRIAVLDGGEGAAGNISVAISRPLDVEERFSLSETVTLPVMASALAGWSVIVTGSGRRLRDIEDDPEGNLGVIVVGRDGRSGTLHTAPGRRFERLTIEWNTHLAVHQDVVARTGTRFHALVHAQPPNLVYLSHVPAYRDEGYLNTRLMRWQPETIVNLPKGLGVLPFLLPGSAELMAANVEGMRSHRVTVWSKHGVMARSDVSVARAVDRIEYAETAARYEVMDLAAGGRADGITRDELRAIVRTYGVTTDLG